MPLIGEVNEFKAYLPLMSICACVSVKRSTFEEGMTKVLLEPVFLVAILIFCQSHLLFSQHFVFNVLCLLIWFCCFEALFADSIDIIDYVTFLA